MNRPLARSLMVLTGLATAAGGVAWSARRGTAPARAPAEPKAVVAPTRPALGRVAREGLVVECRVSPLADGSPGVLQEGADARFEFTISDAMGKALASKVYPSAWLVAHPEGLPALGQREAVQRAATLIGGGLFNPPELDLNVYYVVTLNHNATMSVVDPRFGFGGTKLLALVPLAARGDDWALGPGGRQIFVAMPEVNQVAIVDTLSWKVTANVPGGVRPSRLAVQPDGRFVWVAGGADGMDDSGVTVLEATAHAVVARVRTGRGQHDLAFSDDSRFALVTNAGAGTVSVIDTDTLRQTGRVPTGRRPVSIAYSPRARLAYVTDVDDGTVSSIDPEAGRLVNRIALEPGLGPVRFAPAGAVGFVLNPARNRLHVLDPTTNRVVQQAKTEDGPNQLTFSEEFVYIRHRGSSNILMVSLKTAGREGAALSSVSFTAGQAAPGRMDDPTPADSMVPAPGAGAMLVANPGDRSVYYYKEGLSAPMGTFNNYKRAPRAILVLDKSLRERNRPGVFETTARLSRPGRFDLIFVLDQPRVVHAFPLDVLPDPVLEASRRRNKVDVECLVAWPKAEAGKSFRPLFQLNDRTTSRPRPGLADVEILMYRLGGGWQERRPASEVMPGVYGAEFRPKEPGVYDVCVACDSTALALHEGRRLTVHVFDPSGSGPPPGLFADPPPSDDPR